MGKKILNPYTGRLVNVNGKIGQNLLSQYNSQKGGNITWAKSVQMAYKNLGITNFQPLIKGSKLYNETKKIYTNSNNRVLYGGSGCVPPPLPPPRPPPPRLLFPPTDKDIPLTKEIDYATKQLAVEGANMNTLRNLRKLIERAEEQAESVTNDKIRSDIKSINEILKGASQKFEDWRDEQYKRHYSMMERKNEMANYLAEHESSRDNCYDETFEQHIDKTHLYIDLLEELNRLFHLDAMGGQICKV